MDTALRPHSPVTRVLIARGPRAFGDGFVSLLLPLYLREVGFGPLQVGILATATLLGSGLLTLTVGLRAHRHHYRTLLLAAATLMTATGLGFAAVSDFWPLLVIAVVGTLNPSSGDVSVILPSEHAVLSQAARDRERTAVFARYSLVGALVAGIGALAATLPAMLAEATGAPLAATLQAMFVRYAALGMLVALAYRGLPAARAVDASSGPRAPARRPRTPDAGT